MVPILVGTWEGSRAFGQGQHDIIQIHRQSCRHDRAGRERRRKISCDGRGFKFSPTDRHIQYSEDINNHHEHGSTPTRKCFIHAVLVHAWRLPKHSLTLPDWLPPLPPYSIPERLRSCVMVTDIRLHPHPVRRIVV